MPDMPPIASPYLQIDLDLREPFEPQLIEALTQARASFRDYIQTIDAWLNVLQSSSLSDTAPEEKGADRTEKGAASPTAVLTFDGRKVSRGLRGLIEAILIEAGRTLSIDEIIGKLPSEYRGEENRKKVTDSLYKGIEAGKWENIDKGKGLYRINASSIKDDD
jgi:hypothetical protein